MKKIIFLSWIFFIFPTWATDLDEQNLFSQNKQCALHYLSPKEKKLWTIETPESYCTNQWVQGFTTVTIKDALNRTAHTLTGYFHQGYWLSDFTGKINTFVRNSPEEGVQDFIYHIGKDNDLNTDFYLVARSTQNEKNYTPFMLCPEQPILLAIHENRTNLQQSLFQTGLIKTAKEHLQKICPKATKVHLFTNTSNITTNAAILEITTDFQNDTLTINYFNNKAQETPLKPQELRTETSETLLTIQAQKQPQKEAEEKNNTTKQTTDLPPKKNKKRFDSATDLALSAKVLQTPVKGKTAVWVAETKQTKQAQVTRPYPLLLQTQTSLSTGWHLIEGTFTHSTTQPIVQVEKATKCKKEWCANEE